MDNSLKLITFVTLLLCSAFINAYADEAGAVVWLKSQQTVSGSIVSVNSGALDDQSTAETLTALGRDVGEHTQAINDGLTYLNSFDAQNLDTESLARRIVLNHNNAQGSASDQTILMQRQNRDGGFGAHATFASDILSSAFALKALNAIGEQASGVVSYLVNQQQTDGSWSLTNIGSIVLTAYIADALWQSRLQFNVSGNLDSAGSYLGSQTNANGLWKTTEQSALALIALVQNTIDRTSLQPSVDDLAAQQLSNQSFENDVYLTSLIARLLQTVSEPAPDAMIVAGTVIDGDTGQALPNTIIDFTGADTLQVVTDSQGQFTLMPTIQGQYTLTASLSGYSELVQTTTLIKGDQLNLGNLTLLKLAVDPVSGQPITTGTIRGVVTDRITSQGLSGVTISLTGSSLSAVTDATGAYQISNVPAGAIELVASLPGYQIANGSAELQAQQTLWFSPSMPKLIVPTVTLSGAIKAHTTGELLSGVLISVQKDSDTFTTTTDVNGVYELTNLPEGLLLVSAQLTGYKNSTASADATAGTIIDFSPELFLDNETPEPTDSAGVRGGIIDAFTGTGIEGVDVTVEYADMSIVSAVTDTNGSWQLDDIRSGEVTITLSAAGYVSLSTTLTLQDALLIDLGLTQLTPDDVNRPASVEATVIDNRTRQPLAGVTVKLLSMQGTELHSTVTDNAGHFVFLGLSADDYQLELSLTDYKDVGFVVTLFSDDKTNLNEVTMRQLNIDLLLPDLLVKGVNVDSVTSNQSTFEIAGDIEVSVLNRGNAATSAGFTLVAFQDVDRDGVYDASEDIFLGESHVTDVIEVEAETVSPITLSGQQTFRGAPISVFVDSHKRLAELSEDNNIKQVSKGCNSSSNFIDLGLCIDTSGSVSNLVRTEIEGIIRAIENPDIIPHDGSVRLTVYGASLTPFIDEMLEPTQVVPGNVTSITDALRNVTIQGAGDNISYCEIEIAKAINQLTPVSSFQALTVMGDGAWPAQFDSVGHYNYFSVEGAIAYREVAVQEGIDQIDVIGLGSASLQANGQAVLQEHAYPQPAGGETGVLSYVSNIDEIAEAVKVTLGNQVRMPDLTIGQLLIKDNGVNQPVSLTAVIGNAGSGDTAETVRITFYDGDPLNSGIEIGQTDYTNGLDSGESAVITFAPINAALAQAGRIHAVISFVGDRHECSLDNNTTTSLAPKSVGDIAIEMNQLQFAANEQVDFDSVITNTGALTGDYSVDMSIVDSAGNDVIRFAGIAVNQLTSNAQERIPQTWNTSTSATGVYVAKTMLYDDNGTEVDQAEQAFTIISDVELVLGLRTTTDRSIYHVSDAVEISDLVQNTSVNQIQYGATLQLSVLSPSGSSVFATSRALADLTPSFSQIYTDTLDLNNADPGTYQVLGNIIGIDSSVLAMSQTTFEVVNDARVAVLGEVSVSSAEIEAGDSLTCTDQVTNQSTLAINNLSIRQVLVDMEAPQVEESAEQVINLPSAGSMTDVRSVDTQLLVKSNYACALQALIEGEWHTLDTDYFTVVREASALVANDDEMFISRGAWGVLNVLDNDQIDPADTVTVTVVREPENGNFIEAGNGRFHFFPNFGFIGQESFVYQLDNGRGQISTATVHIDAGPNLSCSRVPDHSTTSSEPVNLTNWVYEDIEAFSPPKYRIEIVDVSDESVFAVGKTPAIDYPDCSLTYTAKPGKRASVTVRYRAKDVQTNGSQYTSRIKIFTLDIDTTAEVDAATVILPILQLLLLNEDN